MGDHFATNGFHGGHRRQFHSQHGSGLGDMHLGINPKVLSFANELVRVKGQQVLHWLLLRRRERLEVLHVLRAIARDGVDFGRGSLKFHHEVDVILRRKGLLQLGGNLGAHGRRSGAVVRGGGANDEVHERDDG
ncbi:hypothetical protein H257_01692 [Aphanomyces astaci]|uniref:Uncharacterized protein n=1 Tax=Aphanomyces astaci TaxID=112090 RepID=W4H4I4_APHAT|nr:hypothetical protein H257_01692 [Aphanomyces astaci]ETV86516.1 hypothetical protein H257_01692 [Aphanomyces astaci]|eukprot:XP_009823315.1 hypothetical protein H257_01692 [Aphanomyces astaci]